LIKGVKNEKGDVAIDVVTRVRYGDLIIPKDSEIRAAKRALEKKKALTIKPPVNTCVPEFSNLVNSPNKSDIVIIVEGKPIYAHKSVLVSRSEYFATLFSVGMRDSSATEIIVRDFKYDVVLDLLKYMYTGNLQLSVETAVQLLEASNFYKVEGLKDNCEYVLHLNVDVESVCTLLEIADKFDARKLKTVCLEFIVEHYEKVMNTLSFKEMERELVVSILKETCRRLHLED
jgi:hypothetical protein